jgi:hypothetical protein
VTTAASIDDIERPLPWGLHDALLLRLSVDWTQGELALEARIMMTKNQDMDQLVRVRVLGLVFCSVDAPQIEPARGYVPIREGGLRINSGPGAAPSASLPAAPEGCFLHWIFVSDWNRFIHICGRHAELTWLEDSPKPSGSIWRALFPGNEIAG